MTRYDSMISRGMALTVSDSYNFLIIGESQGIIRNTPTAWLEPLIVVGFNPLDLGYE
jgi:hypothetical protein